MKCVAFIRSFTRFKSLPLQVGKRTFCQPTRIGQPHPQTHPHLLKPDEVTVGITRKEYIERRQKFVKSLPKGSIAIIPSAPELMISNDIPHSYRQNCNFLYLSGFQEPGSLLVLERNKDNNVHFTMFVQPKEPHKEMWDGPRSGAEIAKRFFGADEAYNMSELRVKLPQILERCSGFVYYDYTVNPSLTPALLKAGSVWAERIQNPRDIFAKMRIVKSEAEINLMRKAASIAAHSFIEAMKFTRAGMPEYQLAAKLEYECRLRGAQRLSYPPVVAGGINANTLHYVSNDMLLPKDELVLVDAGADYHGYVSDITRTWPISNTFSKPQLAIYNLVLAVNQRCIQLCTPGTSINRIGSKARDMLLQGLRRLGVVTGSSINIDKCFPHAIGHYLGMDVHDLIKEVSTDVTLEPGMVITIEPGLYIPVHKDVLPEFRGIGVRIEDDVLITSSEPEVLTHEAPKDPIEIQNILQQRDTTAR